VGKVGAVSVREIGVEDAAKPLMATILSVGLKHSDERGQVGQVRLVDGYGLVGDGHAEVPEVGVVPPDCRGGGDLEDRRHDGARPK